ncbi:MAG: hypothetical protein ACFFDF_12805 [Candidatus Odinarchaeota archaeon]
MIESDQLINEKYRIIIYHGHIHVLSITEQTEDSNKIKGIQNLDNSYV